MTGDPVGFDGMGGVHWNHKAAFAAMDVADAIDGRLEAERIVPDCDGGISFYFEGSSHVASISCPNEGGFVVVLGVLAKKPHITSFKSRRLLGATVENIARFIEC